MYKNTLKEYLLSKNIINHLNQLVILNIIYVGNTYHMN